MNYSYYISPEQYTLGLSHGIANQTLTHRVRIYGWDIERACTEHIKHIDINITDEMKLMLKNNDVSIKIYKNRVKAGWSEEKALNTPRMSKQQSLALIIESRRKIREGI